MGREKTLLRVVVKWATTHHQGSGRLVKFFQDEGPHPENFSFQDEGPHPGKNPDLVVFPSSTEEVVEVSENQ